MFRIVLVVVWHIARRLEDHDCEAPQAQHRDQVVDSPIDDLGSRGWLENETLTEFCHSPEHCMVGYIKQEEGVGVEADQDKDDDRIYDLATFAGFPSFVLHTHFAECGAVGAGVN